VLGIREKARDGVAQTARSGLLSVEHDGRSLLSEVAGGDASHPFGAPVGTRTRLY
jgi:hypothetical protein